MIGYVPPWGRNLPPPATPSILQLEIWDISSDLAPEMFGKPHAELSDDELFQCAAAAQKIRLQRLRDGLEQVAPLRPIGRNDNKQQNNGSDLEKGPRA